MNGDSEGNANANAKSFLSTYNILKNASSKDEIGGDLAEDVTLTSVELSRLVK